MTYKVAILGESAITNKVIESFYSIDQREFSNRFELKIIVSNPSLKKHFRTRCPNCHFISNKNRNERLILSSISDYGINLIVSVQHRWILSNNFLKNVNQPVYNIHNAKLPKYKGHNTIAFEILNNEKYHFTTLHIVDEKIDAGFVVLEKCVLINKEINGSTLF